MKDVKYTKEYKLEAVNLAIKSPSISSAAKSLGLPVSTLHTWLRALKKNGRLDSTASGNDDSRKDGADVIAENRRLHKENMILKEEKDILKKAAAYFAQHQK